MSDIIDTPRTLTVNGQNFTEGQIRYLIEMFPDMDMAKQSKIKVRKDQVLQKAILAGVVLCNQVQTEDALVTLSLSQIGRMLLGKV